MASKKTTKKERLLLVDGDLVLYKITAANTQTIRMAEYEFPMNNFVECLEYFNLSIKGYKSRFDTANVMIFFTHKQNFRKILLPSYKANRTGLRPPSFSSCKADLVAQGAIMLPQIEADDCIGLYATHPDNKDKEIIIVSGDKDFKTIPGALIVDSYDSKNIATGLPKLESERYFYTQILTGDTADNYKGCPGIGPKKAELILEDCKNEKEMWSNVVNTYINNNLTADDALLQARMARILQHGEYDLNTKEVKLWQPPVVTV